jgi:lipopolysaccharide transport system ATP-binding protein
MSAAIEVEGLSKCYRIGRPEKVPETKLGAAAQLALKPLEYLLTRLRKPHADELLWALEDVSFSVGKGEALGIVGHNGSGKTTLFRVLSRITEPSRGDATIRGRVASLLEVGTVGTGFHPELTGRENVYMSGALLGMRKREIDAAFDAIVDFSGVEGLIDTPVKRYSSGMIVRLGFAVAAHLEPEVLLVDEVLEVGDAAFRRQCTTKMAEVRDSGRTILFVSHNMDAVLDLCPNSLWLDHGKVRAFGPTEDIAREYLEASYERTKIPLAEREDRQGNGRMRFTSLSVEDAEGRSQGVRLGGSACLRMAYASSDGPPQAVDVCVSLRDRFKRVVVTFWSNHVRDTWAELPLEGELRCKIPKLPLRPGSYTLDLEAYSLDRLTDHIEDAGVLEILPGDFFERGIPPNEQLGVVLVDHTWGVE